MRPALPDAAGIAASPLAFEDLNTEITAAYCAIAWHAQAVVSPGWDGGASGTIPTWFGVAPYASREVGRALIAAGAALSGLEPLDHVGLRSLLPDLADGIADDVAIALDAFDDEARIVAALVLRLGAPGNLRALLDPRVLSITTARVLRLVRDAPDAALTDRLERVVRTVRNLLTEGNRRIFGDIGPAAVAWLAWRPPDPSPEQVLAELRLGPDDDADAIARVYDRVRLAAERGVVPTRFDAETAGASLLVPAFALYEGARRDPARRDRLIATANVLCAWQEQHNSVQPAFTPPRARPDEVDRRALFGALTATVQLPVPRRGWRFAPWADDHLERRDMNPLTPRVCEYNWADFEDRWRAILGAFDDVYTHPDDVWPPPPGDPHVPDDRG